MQQTNCSQCLLVQLFKTVQWSLKAFLKRKNDVESDHNLFCPRCTCPRAVTSSVVFTEACQTTRAQLFDLHCRVDSCAIFCIFIRKGKTEFPHAAVFTRLFMFISVIVKCIFKQRCSGKMKLKTRKRFSNQETNKLAVNVLTFKKY